eukprot:gene21765-1249_t
MGGIKNFTMFIRKESCDQDRPIVSHVRLPSSSGCIPCNNRGTDICNCSPITGHPWDKEGSLCHTLSDLSHTGTKKVLETRKE